MTIKSPKQRMAEKPYLKEMHDRLVQDRAFIEILDHARLQMVHEQTADPSVQIASVEAYRLQGARQFVSILLSLDETSQPPKRFNPDALPHQD